MNGSANPIRRRCLARVALCLLLLAASGLLPWGGLQAAPGRPPVLASCVARQQPDDSAAGMLAAPGRFDCQRPESDWGAGDFWIRLAVPPAAAAALSARHMPYHLQLTPHWQRQITIYTRDAAGRMLVARYDNASISRHLRPGNTLAIPLAAHRAPVTDIVIKLDGAINFAGLVGMPRLLSAHDRGQLEMAAVGVLAAFGGLGLGLFCYNFLLWLTIRERFQLTYCLSLLAMMAYVWANSGTMALYFPEVPQDVRLQICYAMLAFVAALALQFITDIMEPGVVPPRLRRLARHYGTACVAAAGLILVAPEAWRHFADRLYVATFLPVPPIILALAVTAWRRGSRAVKVLAIAWALPLAMCSLRIAHALHLIPMSDLVQASLVIGMSFEAILSSLAMAFRIKLLTGERDRAIADEQAARHLASIDGLTGLLNRRALLEQVIAWSSPEPLRLLIVDVDHFKQVNDTHGHLVGDEVLRELAQVLAMRADLRASVARLGGEEFALIGTADELGEGIALGILADIRARPLAGVRITASVGMAEGMVQCEDEWRELYRRADDALYRAKAEGRNRAVHAGPEGLGEPALRPAGAHSRAVA